MFVLPINKDNPVHGTPWVVFALFFINGVVLIGEYLGGPLQALFVAHGFTPAHPTIATAFTSMFLHAGFWHVAGNMFFLWMFGNRVENLFGRWFFAAAYLVSGFGSTFFYYLLSPHSPVPLVGASGAISGIVGCFFVLFPRSRFDLVFYILYFRVKTIETHALAAVLVWFVEQTVLGLLTSAFNVQGGTAYWAHFGGFVFGAIIGFMFKLAAPGKVFQAQSLVEASTPEPVFQPNSEDFTELKL